MKKIRKQKDGAYWYLGQPIRRRNMARWYHKISGYDNWKDYVKIIVPIGRGKELAPRPNGAFILWRMY